ncbi:hypothetical protein ACMFMF_009984 [Clarireedia jacksonii]
MKTVHSKLVSNGLDKYKRLISFNIVLVFFSLSMDCLIIGMMSLNNSFVYMQFHPLAYLVKLKIEMSMANLIAKVSVLPVKAKSNYTDPHHVSRSNPNEDGSIPLRIAVKKDVVVRHDDIEACSDEDVDVEMEGEGEGEGGNITPSGSSAGMVRKDGGEAGESRGYPDRDAVGHGREQVTKGPLDEEWFTFER